MGNIDPLVKSEICDLFFIRGLYQKNATNIVAGVRIAEQHGFEAVQKLEAFVGDVEATNVITGRRVIIGNSAIEAVNNLKPYHQNLLLNGRAICLFDLFFQPKCKE